MDTEIDTTKEKLYDFTYAVMDGPHYAVGSSQHIKTRQEAESEREALTLANKGLYQHSHIKPGELRVVRVVTIIMELLPI